MAHLTMKSIKALEQSIKDTLFMNNKMVCISALQSMFWTAAVIQSFPLLSHSGTKERIGGEKVCMKGEKS